MSDIFLSYASPDRSRIIPLVRALETQGWTVWWDRNIEIGSDYKNVIEAELDRAECVVAIWSFHSAASRWARNEVEDAANRNVLIPVLIDDARLPLNVRSIEAARLFDWPNREQPGEIRKLLGAVERLLSSGSVLKVEEHAWRLDPTLSERVARRVVEALRKTGREEQDT